jgi:hypothetical protein
VLVTPDWIPFNDITGWTAAVEIKEAQGVKFYEATIWEETSSIHLYALPNDYDQFYGLHEHLSTEKKVAYRESFCIKKFSGMPAKLSERGPFVLNAFTEFARILVDRHPTASHNLMFTGHGGLIPGGELFCLHLNHSEANTLVGRWHSMLGRKLGFVDMGGPCSKGSFHDLEAYYEHADYYIASDLSTGCTTWDVWTMELYNRSDVFYNYPRLLSSHNTMKDALIARVNLTRLRYEDTKPHATRDQIMQSCYLYSSSAFGKHKNDIAAFLKAQDFSDYPARFTVETEEGTLCVFVDVLGAMKSYGASQGLLDAYKSIIIHGVDTRDFFTWQGEWNGMLWITGD